ncbi:hypothetical protein ACWEIJ_13110 [Lentzea sp. NPDC004789]
MSSVLTLAIVGVASYAIPAQAYMQYWPTSATKRAGADFLPTSTRLQLQGMSCSQPAISTFYIQLVKTRGSQVTWTSGDLREQDGIWWTFDSVPATTGTSYYMRWRENLALPTPCQGLAASPTQ